MESIQMAVVCCDTTAQKFSRIVTMEIDPASLMQRVLDTVEQQLEAGVEREMHNAAHHAEHGPVTYWQQVNDGGFAVFVGEPGNLKEHFFAAGQNVAFMDDEGPGHASKVGPEGVQRTLRVIKGHLAPLPNA